MKRGYITLNGIILKQIRYKESDAILKILTDDRGVISVFCRGGKKLNSSLISSTEPLVYGEFTLYRNKEAYNLENFKVQEMFFSLREDFYRISLAYYLCEIASDTASSDKTSKDNLRLLLNTLYLLATTDKNMLLIKSVFELKLSALLGFAPNLTCCDRCGKFESNYMFLSISDGVLYCDNCESSAGEKTPIAVISAMRHILYSTLGRSFKFTLGENNLKILNDRTEKYFLYHSGLSPKTLDYYKKITEK